MSELVRRILIADDEASVRRAFQDALTPIATARPADLSALETELFGATAKATAVPAYDLELVAQGEEAVAAVRKALDDDKPFGVVFLDMRMPPGIDGTETAKRIRAVDPAINIVLVTGYSDVDVADVALQVLPADKLFFIAKPFEVAEIRQQAAALSARWSHETAMMLELRTQNSALRSIASEARRARHEAEKANVAKSAFLANVSHELRTPLNAIIGFSDIMVSEAYGPLGDARYVDYSKDINSSGKGLLGAINDIIDTARLDIGKIELTRERLDLRACVAGVAAELQPYAVRKSISLTSTAATSVSVVGDNKRLHQALFGIVHNAIKFSPNGGNVELGVEARDGRATVTVRDSGPGMSAELMEAVQRPFAQGENVFARHHGGLGLGLSLAKRLVELHAGRMEIDSAPGVGTTVRIHLPIADAATASAA
jgi:signal transduction histidine kinase